tara:strand:- start:1410 stop:3029 length:1620 start_codon:yes stop_codon:yes gene_type:complete
MSQSSRKFPQASYLVQQPDGSLTSEQALSALNAGLLEVLDSPDGTVASVAKPTGSIVGTSDTQTLTNKTIDASSNTITMSHSQLSSGTGTNTHAQIDTHIAATGSSVHGLGTMSTQNKDAVDITGGTVTGITDLAIADGGTGASTDSGARTNLGLVIGTDVQAQNDILSDLAGLTQASDKGIYFNTGTTASTFDLSSAGRALIDDADAAAQRTTLELGNSATKDTGTGSGDVATGDHVHDTIYINKSNTSAFTPSADYHPATKKYVDDNDEGEANTASNVGSAGIGFFKQKSSLDLQFKNLNAGSNKISLTDDTANNEVDVDVNQGNIDHNQLLNYAAGEHRVIDDNAGDGDTTKLWSADKITDQLATKSGTSHNHDSSYLQIASNLSDLNSALTARGNLGLGDAAVENKASAVFNANALRTKTIKDETPNVNGQILTFVNDSGDGDNQKWKLAGWGLPRTMGSSGQVLKVPSSGSVLEFANESGGGGGSGHVIKDEGGSALTTRTNLNFTGELVEASDNSGSDSSDVTIDAKTAWLYG